MPEINKSQAIRDFYKANPKAKGSEVVDALAKKGITVSANLVNTVKSAHNKAQADKRAATSQIMGTKPEVNKTQAVLGYLKANKKATNSEVVAALAKQGVSVTSNYVATIKAKHNQRRQVVKEAVATGSIGIPEIKSALAFIKSIGSVAAAKQALQVAQEIRAIV
jgi:hypothetical protein